MRVIRHVRLAAATLAAALCAPAPAIGAERTLASELTLLDRVELTTGRKALIERVRSSALVFPIKGEVEPDFGDVAAGYGTARGRMHHGQDVFAPSGTPLVAIRDGVVIATESDGAAGNVVAIYDGEHDRTYAYFHMVEPTALKIGDRVEAGDRVGAVGCTGSCFGDHLHFEVRIGRGLWENDSTDPLPLLERAERARS